MNFYNSRFLLTLLYADECWSLTERNEARLDAFDMRCQKKILHIACSQHISNKILHFLTKQPVLSNTIRKCRLQLLPVNTNPPKSQTWSLEYETCSKQVLNNCVIIVFLLQYYLFIYNCVQQPLELVLISSDCIVCDTLFYRNMDSHP